MSGEAERSEDPELSRSERLEAEATRVYLRYAVEIVEALGFCPYAERARLDGKTRELVIPDAYPTDAAVLAKVESVADDPTIELAVVIIPLLDLGRHELSLFVEELRKAHAAGRRGRAVLAIEGFHPDAEADISSPQRLTPFVRRTPDPTLQLTRLESLERVRRGTAHGTAFLDPASLDIEALMKTAKKRPLHQTISQHNHDQVTTLGVEAVTRSMDDILRDRDAAYAAIDPTIPPRFRS